MRFYSITMKNNKTGKAVTPSSLNGMQIKSQLDNGSFNPAALNIEFDIPFHGFNSPDANAYLRIWGLGLKDISNALDLTPANGDKIDVTISGGMSKGFPLATPSQQGILLTGSIYQAWGNWEGTNQTLDMTFNPSPGSPSAPANYTFNWPKGTQLKDAIAQTLLVAAPTQKQIINISTQLVLNHTEAGTYESLSQFATFINSVSRSIIGGNYQGVQIAAKGDTMIVWDTTVAPKESDIKKIAFQDLIGQPTWVEFNKVSVKTVLRGDLAIGDKVTLPKGLATQTQQTYARFRDGTTFTGNYDVQSIHHYGNFRQPDAASWNTTLELTAPLSSTPSTPASPSAPTATTTPSATSALPTPPVPPAAPPVGTEIKIPDKFLRT